MWQLERERAGVADQHLVARRYVTSLPAKARQTSLRGHGIVVLTSLRLHALHASLSWARALCSCSADSPPLCADTSFRCGCHAPTTNGGVYEWNNVTTCQALGDLFYATSSPTLNEDMSGRRRMQSSGGVASGAGLAGLAGPGAGLYPYSWEQ